MEHHRLLLDIADAGTEEFKVNLPDIHAVKQDSAIVMVVIAQKQIDQRRLARAGGSDYAHDISGIYFEVYPLEHLFCPVVGEGNIFKFNGAPDLLQLVALAEVLLGLGVEYVKYPLG
jgi:hypothetical protein